jgi:hypothetical protein
MHPIDHAKSSVKKHGGVIDDYLKYHEWFDNSKAWVGHSIHRMFKHHSEGIFELEEIFGRSFINSDGKEVYTRVIGEQHVKEDCNGYIPSAKEWLDNIKNNTLQKWMLTKSSSILEYSIETHIQDI